MATEQEQSERHYFDSILSSFSELHSVMKERDRRMDKLSDDIGRLANTVAIQSQNIDRLMTTLESAPPVTERVALLEAKAHHVDGKLKLLFGFKDRVTWGIIGALGASTAALLSALLPLMMGE